MSKTPTSFLSTKDIRDVPLCTICGQQEGSHPNVDGFHKFTTEHELKTPEEKPSVGQIEVEEEKKPE